MSFDALLDHVVHIRRDVPGSDDVYGHPTTTEGIGQPFRAAIQPRTAREIALISQGGAPITDYVIFMRPRLLSSGDKIVHDSSDCPMPEAMDYPDAVFELSATPANAAGRGHHLEVSARLVGTTSAVAGS